MRRRAALVAGAAALAIGLSGCGIPGQTEVKDIGPGPVPGNSTSGAPSNGPPTRESASSKEAFVANFLVAAAGEFKMAEDRVRAYISPSGQDRLKVKAEAGINLVRTIGDPTFTESTPGTFVVTLKVEQVGVLDVRDSVAPATLSTSEYRLTIGTVEGSPGWFVTGPPPDLLLSTTALDAYYTPRTIYFWSADGLTLVPDLRYMPNEVPEDQQPTAIVDWLIAGPSAWLPSAVVRPMNRDSVRTQNVPYPSNRLEVGLNSVAVEQQPGGGNMIDQVGRQLMWSLRPYLRDELALRIDGQISKVFTPDAEYEKANAAHRMGGSQREEPQRFALYDGKIYRLTGSPDGGRQPLPQLLLSEGVNQQLESAALAQETTTDGVLTAAALVRRQGAQVQLRVSSVVGAGARTFADSQPYASMGRPVWLKAPLDTGLVVVGGRLHRFTRDSAALTPVSVPGLDGKITSVAAAPDGRRVAVVANSRVYVVSLSREGAGPEVAQTRQVPTSLRGVTAVDWNNETELVVAAQGRDGKHVVWWLSLDGALEDSFVSDVGGRVTQLVAYPDDPIVTGSVNPMFYRQGVAYDYDGINSLIEAGEVVGATDVKPAQVTAPFFLLD